MSSILDALKKSERQRSLGRDLIFRNASPEASVRLTGFALAVLAALVILIAALIAIVFSLRAPEPEPMSAAQTTAPATPDAGRSPAVDKTIPEKQPAVQSMPPHELERQAEARKPPPIEQASVSAKPKQPVERPTPARAPPQTTSSPPLAGTGAVPWLSSLPESFRSRLPPLSVNIHVYVPDEAGRILYINNRPARQGERIEGGVLVEEIVHDGVILQFQGQRFKLPRPS